MNTARFIFVVTVIAGCLLSCSQKQGDTLQLTSTLPGGIIPLDTTLQWKFSQAVVKPESTNVWLTTPFVDFTPPVPGKFVWQDTSTLIFSPDGHFPGDTKIQAKLNTSLLMQISGKKKYAGPEEFTVATESFRLESAEFFYDRLGEKRNIGVRANLQFTYAVNPADVQRLISLQVDGQPQSGVAAPTTQAGTVIPIELGSVTKSEKPRTITVSFDKQLTSTQTNTTIKMESPFTATLPGVGDLIIYEHEFGFDGTISWITLHTSQEVDSATARKFITLDPDRGYSLEGNRDHFTLRGKFEPGTHFTLTLIQGLESVLGAKLQNDYVADVVVGNIKPSFGYSSPSGIYLLLGGEKKVEFKTVNLPSVLVRVSQVFQNNLVYFLESGRSYDYESYDDEESDDNGGMSNYRMKYRYWLGNYGRLLSSDTLAVQNKTNVEVKTWFDIAPFIQKDYKGFYLIEIADPAQPWRSTSKLVSLSNIGIIVKESGNELLVFTTSLQTTSPLSGAAVKLVSTTNQVIASMKTAGDGVARFSDWQEMRKDFALKLVTAELEDDFNFINLEDYRVETSRFDVGGKRESRRSLGDVLEAGGQTFSQKKMLAHRLYEESVPYDAFLYGDRSIYRPGEKMHISGIVRNLAQGLPAGVPVKLKIVNARGTVVKEMQITLNEQGSFEAEFQTQLTSVTGSYRIELYTGNDIFLTANSVSVEDFVPDRIRVLLDASKQSARPGETISYNLTATNFFGPPASDRNYEFEGTFTVVPYVSTAFPAFWFTDNGAVINIGSPYVANGKTDAQGKASIDFKIPELLASTGLLKSLAKVAVFDESGRPVYQVSRATIYPKNYYIGIRNYNGYYVSPGSPQHVEIIAVDEHDKVISGFRAKVDVIRYEWHSVLRQHQGDNTLRYVSEKTEIVEHSEVITVSSTPFDYRYSVAHSGEYAVRVSKDGDNGYNQFGFYAYSWGTADLTSFRVDPEARVQIVFNDSVYKPGDVARVLFQTPFDGKMLVTVERNQVFTYQFVDVTNSSASLEIPVKESYLPNVYVSAVLFRRITDIHIPLLAGHGFAPLMVEKSSNKINVVINAPEKIRPKTKQTINIQVGSESGIYLTLAAVDEGILQLKNYQTPDPYKYFYQKKALETETYDFFKHLLPEPDRKSSVGGSDEALAKRVNPLGVQRFKPVALWSGLLKTGSDGRSDVTFDIPDFNGELRLMALAYKGDRFGSGQRSMKVSDPVVLTPALPRFVSPGDTVIMPITAFNTTERPTDLEFRIETGGGIVALQKQASLHLGANQEGFSTVTLKATDQIGKATVKVKTNAFGDDLESTTELSVRPTAPYISEAITGSLEGGKSASYDVTGSYLPFGRKSYITLSPFPVANFAKELKYLIGYPYGCIEQTVSRAFPQIYLRDIAVALDPSILNGGSPTYFVNEAISKVTQMQTADGSFLYWPGATGGEANLWASVYATHFLLEAKKAGYAVSEATLTNALRAIMQTARIKLTQDYYYYSANKLCIKRIANKAALYALYVLAEAGTPERSIMDFYRTEQSLLTTDSRYLLAGSFALSGDRRTWLELVPQEFMTEEARREDGNTFDSPIRASALMLNILLDASPENPNIPRFVDYLSRNFQTNRWYSTQDDAFTLLAFGKMARTANATHMTASINVAGQSYSYKGGNERIDIDPFGKRVTITPQGGGRLYYSLVTEGIRSDGAIKVEDKNLQIRREFLNRFNQPVSLSSIKQNDLVVVKLTLNSSIEPLENIAITDLLPAGFEIENPRLNEASNYGFTQNAAVPVYEDMRDDRINIYTNMRNVRQQVFYYMVRAISAGNFVYAPVAAAAMYNADYYSASGGGKVKITR